MEQPWRLFGRVMKRIARFFRTVGALTTLAARIGADWRSAWQLWRGLMAWRYGGGLPWVRWGLPQELAVRIRHAGGRAPLWLSTTPEASDMLVLFEIFGQQVYRLEGCPAPRTILDLGSYTGISAVYFALQYPQASIYCLEPDPENFSRLERNTASLPQVIRVHGAIASATGTRALHLSPTQTCGHSLYPAPYLTRQIEVPCTTLPDVIARTRWGAIDVMKFDVEGAEREIFQDLAFPVAVQSLLGELHLSREEEQAFCRRFEQQGYRVSVRTDEFFQVRLFQAMKAA